MTQSINAAGIVAPHLSDALRKASTSIRDVWEATVRRELPGADPFTLAALRGRVAGIVLVIADTVGNVAAQSGVASNENATACPEKLPEGYRIDEMMTLWGLLRRALLEEVPRHMNRELFANEVVALDDCLERIIRDDVMAHCAMLGRQIQAGNDAMAKYLSFLSHDLRGGLNSVFLMTEVLRREMAGRADLAETLEDVEIMRRSIVETVATMDRFLYSERFRMGKVRVRPAPFSLKTLAAEIGSRFSHAAKEQGIEFAVEAMDRAQIVSDRELLALALHAIAANAVKNTAAGNVLLSVRPAQGGWRVEVADTGPGIAPEQLETIRDSFLNPALGRPGPGLGLSLASQAGRAIGATMGVESTLGKGSRFWVEVPAERVGA